MEIFKPVADKYEVSNFGNARSWKSGDPKILKPQITKRGYLYVQLYINGKHEKHLVHRLVAQAFIANPDNKPEVNHLNGVKSDNRVENLEWVTRSENNQHAHIMGLATSGGRHAKAKLTDAQAAWIRHVYIPRHSEFGQNALARKFNVSVAVIHAVIHNKKYCALACLKSRGDRDNNFSA